MRQLSSTLPYTMNAEDRKKPFTSEMEIASILCLAEEKRGKGGLLKAPLERSSFVSKLYYPMYAVPWRDGCLVIDGLGLVSNTIAYISIPDIEAFISDFKRTSTDRELYRRTLAEYIKTFESFKGEDKVSVDFVIMNKNLLSELSGYVRKENLRMLPDIKMVSPKFDEEIAQEKARKLVEEWERVRVDIEALKSATAVLTEETKSHNQKILEEINQVKEKYAVEINRIKPDVESKIEDLKKKRDTELLKAAKADEKELAATSREHARYEHELRRLAQKVDKCVRQKETYKRRKNKDAASYWNSELKKYRKEVSLVKKKILIVSRRIKKIRIEGELKVKELNEKYQEIIEGELNKIKKLEMLRESEINARGREMDELNSKTSAITNSIGKLIESKRLQKSNLEGMVIQLKLDETTLIGIPFYIVRYESERRARYDVYPQMRVKSYEGVLKSIKRAISVFRSKISFLLEPISRELAEYFTKHFLELVDRDERLGEELYELGSSGNLLTDPDLEEVLTKGLKGLKDEGWISQDEFSKIMVNYLGS